ncbi:MAG: glycosyltransferase family 4 protein, partial [Acetobacteraceae bacterium]|nr:glycosyltransferase family 4 protein [Acetobacteraceae bacterium]
PPLPRLLAGPSLPAPRAAFGVLASGNPWNLAAVRGLDAAIAEAGGADWLLAGSVLGASGAAQGLRSRPLLLGRVDTVEEFYDAVGCVLAPNTGGTGLKIKTVEALLSGRPVIGTAHAFTGLPATHEAHAAPDLPALAALARRHAADAAFREEVAHATRRLALAVLADVGVQQDALAAMIAARVPPPR